MAKLMVLSPELESTTTTLAPEKDSIARNSASRHAAILASSLRVITTAPRIGSSVSIFYRHKKDCLRTFADRRARQSPANHADECIVLTTIGRDRYAVPWLNRQRHLTSGCGASFEQ